MIKIALVEDSENDRNLLMSYIERFQNTERDEAIDFSVDCYSDGMDFVTDYNVKYDIVFMDIQMPLLDGLATAKRLREMDKDVGIIFVTNIGKYAINGYEVNAIDFLVKPVTYFNFVEKLKKALVRCSQKSSEKIFLKVDDGYVSLPISKIYYLEKSEHDLIYHTEEGNYRYRVNMADVEKDFLQYDCFVKCTRGCIVNLQAVTKIDKKGVHIGSEYITISRGLIKPFKEHLLKYLRSH